MRIIIEGTSNEIEKAKQAIDSVCFLDMEFCEIGLLCEECEKRHLEIKYIIK